MNWLQGQVTQNLRELQVGEVAWSCLCTRSGMLRAVMRIGRVSEGLLVASDAEGLDAIEGLVRETVFLEDVSWSLCHSPTAAFLRGPGADLLAESLGALAGVSAWRGQLGEGSVIAVRFEYGGLIGWDLFSEAALEGDFAELLGAVPLAEPGVWESARIEAGIPVRGVDWDEKTLPPELGPQFEGATTSYTKGCYVGQEVLMRIYARGHVNWNWRGLFLDSQVEPGAKVQDLQGQRVGHVQSVAESPERSWIATARLRSSAVGPSDRVFILSGNSRVEGSVTDFPFPPRPAS